MPLDARRPAFLVTSRDPGSGARPGRMAAAARAGGAPAARRRVPHAPARPRERRPGQGELRADPDAVRLRWLARAAAAPAAPRARPVRAGRRVAAAGRDRPGAD